ncbi:MAG: hypothetical protein EA381_04695 [Planctomycetaceae bacterium]|nr:MAG: hypothetical protein EA381_04695 [Planctomycetaceae bacterium]
MWPLDLALMLLGSLVGYTLVSQFRFDDPRYLYNAWTYVALVVSGVIGLSLLSRFVASRFVEKSAQLGFLASILVHLGLLMMAVNVIVFGRYFPETFSGSRPEQIAQPKTVPDYLFSQPDPRVSQPDWAQPVPAEASSQVEPLERNALAPRNQPSSLPEFSPEQPSLPPEPRKAVADRSKPEDSMPLPADSPNQPSRNVSSLAPSESPLSPVEVPQVPERPVPSSEPTDRLSDTAEANPRRASQPQTIPSAASALPDELPELRATPASPSPLLANTAAPDRWAEAASLPRVAESDVAPSRTLARSGRPTPDPAGAAPAAQSVPLVRSQPDVERALDPGELPLARTSRPVAAGSSFEADKSFPSPPSPLRSGLAQLADKARTGPAEFSPDVPHISAGSAETRPADRSDRTTSQTANRSGSASGPVIDTQPLATATAAGTAATTATEPNPGPDPAGPAERLALSESRRASGRSGATFTEGLAATELPPAFPLPGGAGTMASPAKGHFGAVASAEKQPQIADFAPRPDLRRRAEAAGGPMQPVGAEIAAAELFQRRILRTDSGAAPIPAAAVGPETEEAIERGLRYLASRQASEGHWSLQGHGEQVLLRSDTAATGLCLLAFQGAGYTHQQHRYANVVDRGLKALISMQAPDGNLYRSENPASDQSVAFYSHGIAALALCEAFGMSRDETLRDAAQKSIDYIVLTQHRQRGGWRYQPQVSSDTSVSGWMMMALKSGELAGLRVPQETYEGIDRWLEYAKLDRSRSDRYRYNPFAPDTPAQAHGREVTPAMTSVAILMRMYSGWRRDNPDMQSAADYLAQFPPQIGDRLNPQRDTYYWYYATQVMFHMGGNHWQEWNGKLKPILLDGQVKSGPMEGSWDPVHPVPDRWSVHAGRLYLTTLNLLSLEVYYRHLPIYDNTAR